MGNDLVRVYECLKCAKKATQIEFNVRYKVRLIDNRIDIQEWICAYCKSCEAEHRIEMERRKRENAIYDGYS